MSGFSRRAPLRSAKGAIILPSGRSSAHHRRMEPGKGDRITLVGLTIILVIHFVGLLGPTDEVPSATLSTITILLEVGMVSALVALGSRVLRSLPPDALRGGWIFLLVVGAGAGLGIFGIRLSGGQRLELPPRRTSVTDLPSVPTANTTPDSRIRDMFALAQHPAIAALTEHVRVGKTGHGMADFRDDAQIDADIRSTKKP